mmetsp:Transcript_22691/g.47806  ORF Transcript_22691/g.47806 Transcript_22691/m.47806 type:complete len:102 (+) Transcript_22691:413-718(+)
MRYPTDASGGETARATGGRDGSGRKGEGDTRIQNKKESERFIGGEQQPKGQNTAETRREDGGIDDVDEGGQEPEGGDAAAPVNWVSILGMRLKPDAALQHS